MGQKPIRKKRLICTVLTCALLFGQLATVFAAENSGRNVTQADGGASTLVTPSGAKLNYSPYNTNGDTLGDFSGAGFYAGAYELPVTDNLPVAMTVSPTGGDDRAALQAAIDQAAITANPERMTVVKLTAGTFNISAVGTGASAYGIKIPSGIVLSGSGQGPTGTVLKATSNVDYNVVVAEGRNVTKLGAELKITDTYVPAGRRTITVSDASTLAAGDLVAIATTSPQAWLAAVEMDRVIGKNGDDLSWYEGRANTTAQRIVTGVSGNTVTLDYPLYVPLDSTLAPATLYKLDESGYVKNFGIENLRIDSIYASATDEAHAGNGIRILYAKDGFVRNVTAKHLIRSAVLCDYGAKHITVQDCACLKPVAQIAGSRRYGFAASHGAQQILFVNCYSEEGRHDYMATFPTAGPVVFVDSIADNAYYSSETHGIWSTGVLYDNIYQVGKDRVGFIALANRGSEGSQSTKSQGWTAAGSVAWNCLAPTVLVQKLPGNYQNFAIGAWGNYPELVTHPSNAMGFLTAASNSSHKVGQLYEYAEEYRTRTVNSRQDLITSYMPIAINPLYATVSGESHAGDGYKESGAAAVEPRSLFKAQLAERITGDYRNATPQAPVITGPAADLEQSGNSVTISGYYQKGATAVTVYVDDTAYPATLSASDNTFTVTRTLDNGWHKIYATATVSGRESPKTADRFIKTGASNAGNPQSVYSRQKTALFISDPRLTFDATFGEAPGIAGPTEVSLEVGYGATSSGAYTVTGDPAPTITKASGDGRITWNATRNCLDIQPGLAAGNYPVTLKASNGVAPDATLTVTVSVKRYQLTLVNDTRPELTWSRGETVPKKIFLRNDGTGDILARLSLTETMEIEGQTGAVTARYADNADYAKAAGTAFREYVRWERSAAAPMISMEDYAALIPADQFGYTGWILDTDGWFYWSKVLKPGDSTGEVLSGVTLVKAPDQQMSYTIDVAMEGISADLIDYEKWTRGADALSTRARDMIERNSGAVRCPSAAISGAGHSYGNWTTTKRVTATQDGERTRTCSACEYVQTEVIPAGTLSASQRAAIRAQAIAFFNGLFAADGK